MPDSDDEMIANGSVHIEQQPGTRIARDFSMHGRSAESVRAPSTSAISTQSNTTLEHKVNTPQPCFDPSMQLVNDGYLGIQNTKVKRKLLRTFLDAIQSAEAEDAEF